MATTIFIISMVLLTIGLLICLCGIAKCHRDGARIEEVGRFRHKLIQMAHDYNVRHVHELDINDVSTSYDWFVDKWSFDAMVRSSKPLTLGEWYTEEEIRKINE